VTSATVLASTAASVATWLTAIGTIAASVLALAFGLGLRDWWQRPRLRLVFDPAADADRVTVPTAGGSYSAWVRLRVANEGHTAAKNVQVTITGVSTWAGRPGRWVRGKFDLHGRALVWSNSPRQAVAVDIPPGGERYVDLVAIPRDWQNQGMIEMTLQIGPPPPASQSGRLSPGSWQFALELSADNLSAVTRHVGVTFNGVWPDNPPDRIWNEIAVAQPASTPHDQPPRPANLPIEEQLAQAVAEDEAAE
jgi:hypothetical protein